MKKQGVPVVFNLFPRHFKYMDEWAGALPHVVEMNFNAVFVNPFHETGFSGSLYAVKDYYKLNPLFLRQGQKTTDFGLLQKFIDKCKSEKLDVIMDLVINHTAVDSVLTTSNPAWYRHDESGKLVSPYAIDPGDPGKVTVWGDLAIVENEGSSDQNGLWKYWDNLIAFFQKMGILGFRCDAAYQVPASLWKFLISSAKKRNSETRFYAETLGCQLWQIEALAPVGFDYLFNSSKWWNFDQTWALDQHEANRKIAPSIGFPESHDTERLASIPPGSMVVQKYRYAFAAVFSEGILMPMGYEYGAVTRMDVVHGTPNDVDKPRFDISSWIGEINKLKMQIPVLQEEGIWHPLCAFNLPYLFLQKASNRGAEPIIVCVNKQLTNDTVVEEWMLPQEVKGCKKVIQMLKSPNTFEEIPPAFILDPADILIFLNK
jgi:starch synthase (maltosyl-transferring)